jgi:hypothetical protein
MIQFHLPTEFKEEYGEEIAEYVQLCGGQIALHKFGLDFYVPIKEITFLAIKYPFLTMEKYVW